MSDFLQRLEAEQNELVEKAEKLEQFLPTARFAELPERQRQLMRRQHEVMLEYILILGERLRLLRS